MSDKILNDEEWNKAEKFSREMGESPLFWGVFIARMKACEHPDAIRVLWILDQYFPYCPDRVAVEPGTDYVTIHLGVHHNLNRHSLDHIKELEVTYHGTDYNRPKFPFHIFHARIVKKADDLDPE